MGQTRRRSTATYNVIGMIGMLAACSSSSSDTIDLGTTPDTAATTSAAFAASSTSQPAPTSNSAPSTETSTAPLTPEDQVKADFLAVMAIRRQCSYDPAGCDFAGVAIQASIMDDFLRATVKERISANLRLVGDDTSTVTVTSVQLRDSSKAIVKSCIYDPVVMYDVGGSPSTDDDIVFDENAYSIRSEWSLSKTASGWKIEMGTATEQTVGENQCAS